ncbi:hypothetical protein [Vitreimonas flagellata]|uniref:hypothetical protein n=1 Tax=Vitreimonas flagellata TaxID=2560861 RepID=UPI0010755D86|nr:hypothetical protein [Vitreimonas flagellata]
MRIFPTELLIEAAAEALGGEAEAEPVTLRCPDAFERPRNSTALIRAGAPLSAKWIVHWCAPW